MIPFSKKCETKKDSFATKKAFIDTGKGFYDIFCLYFQFVFDKIGKLEERVASQKGRAIKCQWVKKMLITDSILLVHTF
jgi:hypothetical protein